MKNSENNLNNIEDTDNIVRNEKTAEEIKEEIEESLEEQTLNEYRREVLDGKGSRVKSAENLSNRKRQDRHTGRGLGYKAYNEGRKISIQMLQEKDDGGKSEIEKGIRDYNNDYEKGLTVEEGLNIEYGEGENEYKENWKDILKKDQIEALKGSAYAIDKDNRTDRDTRTKEQREQDKGDVKSAKKEKYFGRDR